MPQKLELIIVSAAQVVATVGAYQLAFVAGQAVRAGGADLAVMIDWRFVAIGGADRSALPEIRGNFIGNLMIEDVGSVGKHG